MALPKVLVKIRKRRVLRQSPTLRSQENEEEIVKNTKKKGKPKECVILEVK